MIAVGTTLYSEDGKKSVTITGPAPRRRDRYHADYYPVTIVDAKGNKDYDRLSYGVINNRFPRTAPKPETGKTITTERQMANAIKKVIGGTVATGRGDAYYTARRFDYTYIDQGLSSDEFVVCNLSSRSAAKLLEAGFECRKVVLGDSAVDVWSK